LLEGARGELGEADWLSAGAAAQRRNRKG
jgi:hypothetical protein